MERRPKEEQQMRLLVELSDENGYSQTELIKKLNIKKPNMSTMCDDLKNQGLIYGKFEPEKKRERGGSGQGIYYYIGPEDSASHQEKLAIFRAILKLSLLEFKPDLEKSLLSSKYVNSLIKTCGLMPFYEILEEYIGGEEFRRIATETLLGQSALIEEYVKLPPAIMRECIESEKEMVVDQVAYFNNSLDEKYLKKLFEFNTMESIRFYRKYLATPFGKLYRDLADMDDGRRTNLNISEGIKRFLDLDIFLSPVTSFPQNSPISLLFAKPFERLYSDIYILDDSDYEIMVQRAYLVYTNFTEVLKLGFLLLGTEEELLDSIDQTLARLNLKQFETKRYWFLKSLRKDLFCWKDYLNILIKEMIFYWNIASLRLDFVYCRLRDREKGKLSNTGYHFLANSDGILAEDIDEKRNESFQWMTREDTIAASLYCGESNPFSNLRYCYCFEDLNLEEKRVSFEEIILALENT